MKTGRGGTVVVQHVVFVFFFFYVFSSPLLRVLLLFFFFPTTRLTFDHQIRKIRGLQQQQQPFGTRSLDKEVLQPAE